MTTQSASAAVVTSGSKDKDPNWQIKSLLYYRAVAHCFKNSGMSDGDGFMAGGRIANSDINTGLWFGQSGNSIGEASSPAGVYLKKLANVGSGGKVNCGEESKSLITTAMAHWGIDATRVLCEIGMIRVDMGAKQSVPDCISGDTQLERPAGAGSLGWDAGAVAFKNYISKTVYGLSGGKEPDLLDHEWYLFYKTTLANSCIPGITSRPSGTAKESDNQLGYNGVKWVDTAVTSSAADMVVTGSYNGALKKTDNVVTRPGGGPSYSEVTLSCAEIVSRMNPYAASYATWAFGNKVAAEDADKAVYGETGAGGANSEGTSCRVEGIGWVLCPVANAMAGITDALFNGVKAFMTVAPLSLNPQDNALYTAWSVMRTIANVAFVIVFLIIIFSQLTSAGVSNYGVKKLLPRLIVGAILVNVSYFICAIAVDISNILGVGIQESFGAIAAQAANTGVEGENWGSIVLAVLSGSTVAVGVGLAVTAMSSFTIWTALAALLPLLVGALFALVIAFLVLLARQALIIMLIVLAPLAFVAYLLPNTEDLYKKWQKLFMTLLVLFPMLSVVFGGSMLASVILRAASTEAMAPGAEGNGFIAFCLYIGSFAVQAIPFFITPLLINLSQGVLGRFAGLVNNKGKGPFDRLRKGGERIAKDAQNRGFARKLNAANRGSLFSAGARRRARVERVSGSLDNIAKHNAGDYIGEELANKDSNLATRMAGGDTSQATIIAAKAVAAGEAEELREAMQPLLRQLSTMDPSNKRSHLSGEINAGGPRRSAALHYAAQIGDTGFLREQLGKNDSDITQKAREAINANSGSVIGKAPDLIKGAQAAFGSVKGSDLVQFKPDTAEAYVAHIRSLSQNAEKLNISNPGSKESTDAAQQYKMAVDGFNSAVEDIARSPELQGQFSADLGTKLSGEIIGAQLRGERFANDMGGAAGIQADGKIR